MKVVQGCWGGAVELPVAGGCWLEF